MASYLLGLTAEQLEQQVNGKTSSRSKQAKHFFKRFCNGLRSHANDKDASEETDEDNLIRAEIDSANESSSYGTCNESPSPELETTENFRGIRLEWSVKSSFIAKNTLNPIRQIVDGMKLTPNPEKQMIALSIGDPTIYGNFSPPEEAIEAVIDSLRSKKFDGYAPSTGILAAREAVARYSERPTAHLSAKDVILTSGASHALEMCISVLCDRGSNLLIPQPGFSIYKTIACSIGVQCRSYRLQPELNWEVDLEHLASMIDDRTAAIVINNPSNPCGSVYSREHLLDILEVAEHFKVPIIADEIYDDLVFPGHEFIPIASLTDDVPVLACNGLTKKFICPGWRMGWVLVHDRNGIFEAEVRPGLVSLSQRILGPNATVQAALPRILSEVPASFFQNVISTIHANALLAFNGLSQVPGLTPIMPEGAMYMMVRVEMSCFPEFVDDLTFTTQMVSEESVFCLPGKCFEFPNYFRIVLTLPEERMMEAVQRIYSFCVRHYVPAPGARRLLNGTSLTRNYSI